MLFEFNHDHYQLMLGLEKPLNIGNGYVNLSVPTSVDELGNVHYSNERLSLKEERPLNLVAAYQVRLNKSHSLSLHGIIDSERQQQRALSLNYRLDF